MSNGDGNGNDEMVAMQEELAAARAELERLSEHLADREARAAHLEERLGAVQAELVEARAQTQSAQAVLVEAHTQLEDTRQEARVAVLKYREAVLAAEPWLPAEMVGGETVAEIEEALAQTRHTVAQVRQQLEQEAQSARVPTGAPPRRPPDLSALSPLEKIRMGLQQRPHAS